MQKIRTILILNKKNASENTELSEIFKRPKYLQSSKSPSLYTAWCITAWYNQRLFPGLLIRCGRKFALAMLHPSVRNFSLKIKVRNSCQ